jgi:hypothetical protein
LTAFAVLVGAWSKGITGRYQEVVRISRNFYGVLKVNLQYPPGGEEPDYVALINGQVEHGGQFLDDDRKFVPTSYYGRSTGLGRAFDLIAARPSRRIGVVGLGTGTVAAYAKSGDYFRFYEINPAVIPLAIDLFTYFEYLKKGGAKYSIIVGDARLSLETEPDQSLDLMIVDAFSGDSIPVHLLTREAAALYLRHLKPNGILAIHVSNQFLDLTRTVKDIAVVHGLDYARIKTPPDPRERQSSCDWILLVRSGTLPQSSAVAWLAPTELPGPMTVWTDDRSSLFEVLRIMSRP